MMAIKLSNKTDLETALEDANAKVRNLSVSDVEAIIKSAENRLLDMGIAKSNHKGASFVYENGHKMPSSYNGRPGSTKFTFEKRSSDWYITGIYRGDCDHNREIFFKNQDDFRNFYKF